MEKLKLKPVEALLLQWSSKSLSGNLLKSFMDHLDLSRGNELYSRCSDVCNWYEEVILNGKYFFNSYLDNFLASTSQEHLVVLFTAGKSTLSLELCLSHFEKVNHILEIDKYGMEVKKELYDRHYPQFTDKIKCINADISSSGILEALSHLFAEYYKNLPLIIILESATFFLTKSDLKKIARSFCSPKLENTIILEYLIPPSNLTQNNLEIQDTIFECIREYSDIPEITPYTKTEINEIFSGAGGRSVSSCNMHTMEKNRLGKNIYFNNPNSGWIECGVWKI